MCTQWWRADDGGLHFCGQDRGHSGECVCLDGRSYSELVEMI